MLEDRLRPRLLRWVLMAVPCVAGAAAAVEPAVPQSPTEPGSPAAFSQKVQRDHRQWGEVIRSTGFTLDQ